MTTPPRLSPNGNPLAFVLVPGGFCLPSVWGRVTARLRALGYRVEPVSLLTVGSKEKSLSANAYDDADHVKSIVSRLADDGYDVVLAGNSYGSFVSMQGSKGLSRSERDQQEKAGGSLIHLVLLGAMTASEGQTIRDLLNGLIPAKEDSSDTYKPPPPNEQVLPGFFSDLPTEELTSLESELGLLLGGFNAACHDNPLTYAGWKFIPTTHVITKRDLVVKPEWQEQSHEEALKSGTGTLKKVVLEADHVCMISKADEVTDILLEAGKAR